MPAFPPGAHVKGGATSRVVNVELADEFYAPIIPIIAELRMRGLSLRAIARDLDRRGVKTRQWLDRWSATQVRRVLARAARERGPGAGANEEKARDAHPSDQPPSPL